MTTLLNYNILNQWSGVRSLQPNPAIDYYSLHVTKRIDKLCAMNHWARLWLNFINEVYMLLTVVRLCVLYSRYIYVVIHFIRQNIRYNLKRLVLYWIWLYICLLHEMTWTYRCIFYFCIAWNKILIITGSSRVFGKQHRNANLETVASQHY